MERGGLFITLYDKETLRLYLDRGVYGQHMNPEDGTPSPYSAHYRTLADYACGRKDKHVFFFLDREIYYGGQLKGPENHGAFYLNGQKSPMGREAEADLVWDESSRDRYEQTDEQGVFLRNDEDDGTSQPFLFLFEDQRDLAGTFVISDQLYFELGEYPYPLPSNTIEGMGVQYYNPWRDSDIARIVGK